ncbi:MAG: glycosyltransferase family 2 protein [Lepagella sp.]
MISVVIPLYNKEALIGRTLESVLAQSYQDFEVVVVNDGSSDGSAAVVESFADPRIRLIRQENAGVSAARNRGIAEARGEFIALLDGDDIWRPDYLATVANLIERYPQCGVFATGYEFVDEFNRISPLIIRNLSFNDRDGVLDNYFHVASTSHPPLWTSIVTARKSAFEAVGGFPVGVTSGEDLLTWARLACRYQIAYSTRVEAQYFTPTTGITGKVPADLRTTKDAVGLALNSLSKEYRDKGVDEYVSFWYKMRAVINLGHLYRSSAFRCAAKALRYKPTNLKALSLLILSISPKLIINKILHK